MLKKILVCLDGSKFAEGILPHAIERARHFNSKIILLKVITVNIAPYATAVPGQPVLIMPGLLENNIRTEEMRAKSYLDGVAKRLRETGLDADWVALHGIGEYTVSSIIVTYATENKVDLIMMATRGRSFWKRFMFGSVTESVIRESSTPVLVVKPKDIGAKESAFSEIPQGALA